MKYSIWYMAVFISITLNGCVAAALVGMEAGKEVVTDRILPTYKRKGAALEKMAAWNGSEVKTTYSASGKEEWNCAHIHEGRWDDTGSYEYLCLPSNEKLIAIDSYECKEGKGGIISMVVNKQSMQTVFCKIQK